MSVKSEFFGAYSEAVIITDSEFIIPPCLLCPAIALETQKTIALGTQRVNVLSRPCSTVAQVSPGRAE